MKLHEVDDTIDGQDPNDVVRHDNDVNYQSNTIMRSNNYVINGFSDAWPDKIGKMPFNGRDLLFLGQPQSLHNWQKVMNQAAPVYNNFNVDKMYTWFIENIDDLEHYQFIPGRAGGPVLYVMGEESHLEAMGERLRKAKDELLKTKTAGTMSFLPSNIGLTTSNKVMIKNRTSYDSGQPNRGWKTIGKNFPMLKLYDWL